jgi:hypothetical protein
MSDEFQAFHARDPENSNSAVRDHRQIAQTTQISSPDCRVSTWNLPFV